MNTVPESENPDLASANMTFCLVLAAVVKDSTCHGKEQALIFGLYSKQISIESP